MKSGVDLCGVFDFVFRCSLLVTVISGGFITVRWSCSNILGTCDENPHRHWTELRHTCNTV